MTINKKRCLDVLLKTIEKKKLNFNQFMIDNYGDWLYDERAEIEKDLGITLETFDNLSELERSVKILQKHGALNWDGWSAQEMATILDLESTLLKI